MTGDSTTITLKRPGWDHVSPPEAALAGRQPPAPTASSGGESAWRLLAT